VASLAAEVAEHAVDGLTVSGGEPFAQAPALVELIREVRRRRDLSVCCYTGFTLERLTQTGDDGQRELLGLTDLLIDGPYVQRRHAALRWRASANQRLHALTPRHRQELTLPDLSAGLQIEVTSGADVHWLGVPPTPGFREAFASATSLLDGDGQGG
jgi:anaerobic ribonucleoside-triphosphate reductase activating protein